MYDEQEQLPVSKLIFATSPCQQTIDEIFHNSVYLKWGSTEQHASWLFRNG